MPRPTCLVEVQRFMGVAQFLRIYIKDLAKIMAPITRLTRKSDTFVWTDECEAAMELVKEKYTNAPILISPKWDLEFHVHTDASNIALGVMLAQNVIGKADQPIAYASRLLNSAGKNYTTTKREALAMVYALNKFRHYLLGNKFVFYVDHMALVHLVNKQQVSGRIARWLLLFLEYDFTVVYKPGRSHVMADALSRLPNGEAATGVQDQTSDASLFSVTGVWYEDVEKFLRTGIAPSNLSKDQKRRLFLKSIPYSLIENQLYKKCVDQVVRRCVYPGEVSTILHEMHNQPRGGHFSTAITVKKILQGGYWWPTLHADTMNWCKACDKCQRT